MANKERAASNRFDLRQAAIGAAWLAAMALGLRLIDLTVGRTPLGGAVLGAAFVELLASRAGVRWSVAGESDSAKRKRAAVLVGVGGATAAVVVCATVVLAMLGMGEVTAGRPSSALAFGVVRAAGLAVREEVMFRGLVLHAAERAHVRPAVSLALAALAGAAPIALLSGTDAGTLALALSFGLVSARLWAVTRSPWASLGFHAFWTLLAGSAIRGGIVDVVWKAGSLGDVPKASGIPAATAAVLLLVAAVAIPRLKTLHRNA